MIFVKDMECGWSCSKENFNSLGFFYVYWTSNERYYSDTTTSFSAGIKIRKTVKLFFSSFLKRFDWMIFSYIEEYGFPSTHAMFAAGIPLSLVLLSIQRYDVSSNKNSNIQIFWYLV